MHRYLATRAEVGAVLEARGQPRYRADQVFDGLWTQRRPLESLTNIGNALRNDLQSDLPLALTPVTVQRGDEGMTVKWLWSVDRRRPGRDGADALPRPRHGLHLVPGGMCDGLHVLRDRASRLRPAPRCRRDLRTGPPRAARFAAARRQRRLHGHGRTARERRARARVADALAPRRGASRPATSRCRRWASCPGCTGSGSSRSR